MFIPPRTAPATATLDEMLLLRDGFCLRLAWAAGPAGLLCAALHWSMRHLTYDCLGGTAGNTAHVDIDATVQIGSVQRFALQLITNNFLKFVFAICKRQC